MKTYKAKADCIAGGKLRRKGQVFQMREPSSLPKHLEEVRGKVATPEPAEAPTPRGRRAAAPVKDGVSKADLGLEKPTPVQDVTSKDMVKAK